MILTEEKFRKRIVSRLVLIWFNRPHIKYRAIAFLMYRKIQGAICVIITLVMLITAASLPASTLGAPNDGTNLSKKDLKSLSNCQAKSAKDGNLTQLEVTDCYNQLFPQGQSVPQGISANGSSITKKDLKSLSNCQAKSAKDGDLTQPEVTDCYNQLFPQGTTAPNGQSAPQNNLNPQGTTAPNGKTFPEGVSLPTGLGPREGQGYSTNLPLGPHGEADEKLK
jgi:hypothetical protein